MRMIALRKGLSSRFSSRIKRTPRLFPASSSISTTRTPRARRTPRALESVNNFPVVMVARTESRTELTHRLSARRKKKEEGGKWPRGEKGGCERGSERFLSGQRGEIHENDDEDDNSPLLRRSRVSSRALDLITKVTRCSTTTLKGIKSCRWAPPLFAHRGNIAYIRRD